MLKPLLDQSTKDLSLLKNQRSSVNIGVVIGNILGGLFKKAVDLVEEVESQFQSTFVNESFGFCYFLRCVYTLCDKQCNEILTYYSTIRDLKILIDNTKQLLQQYISAEDGKENHNLDNINQVLNEISLFLQHHESFSRYLCGKGNDSFNMASKSIRPTPSYQSKMVLPVELTNDLNMIQQKRVIPQGNQLASFRVLLMCIVL